MKRGGADLQKVSAQKAERMECMNSAFYWGGLQGI